LGNINLVKILSRAKAGDKMHEKNVTMLKRYTNYGLHELYRL